MNKKAEEIKKITPEIKELVKDMIETLLKGEQEGVGLAAPQVGVSKRIFIARTENGLAIFINPKIIKKSRGIQTLEEGCLSLPGIYLKIKRAKLLELEALDIAGKKINIKAEGFFARILQHEMDHLDGVLIIDRVNFWRKIKGTLTK